MDLLSHALGWRSELPRRVCGYVIAIVCTSKLEVQPKQKSVRCKVIERKKPVYMGYDVHATAVRQ
jgi:hypothetical protein